MRDKKRKEKEKQEGKGNFRDAQIAFAFEIRSSCFLLRVVNRTTGERKRKRLKGKDMIRVGQRVNLRKIAD